MAALCRDCTSVYDTRPDGGRCAACGSLRLLVHPELSQLAIAHIDCDAFYASVEQRDNPALRDKPLIVGGYRRGVVTSCCYAARAKGVRSAMPTYRAMQLCPEANVVKPRMAVYSKVGREVRELMDTASPLVQPISIDEAFLDMGGTGDVHGGPPAQTIAKLAGRIERDIGITVSVGLSYNKFLAKVASDLGKPRGFTAIGRAEAVEFLRSRQANIISGVGKVMERRLAADGIKTVGDIQATDEADLVRRYGAMGTRMAALGRGEDNRAVETDRDTKSVSAETTFETDLARGEALTAEIWPLCEEVAARLKQQDLSAGGVTLKLKTASFRLLTRSRQLDTPTRLAEVLFRTAAPLVEREANGQRFRLIGISASHLGPGTAADGPELFGEDRARWAKIEDAMASVRGRFGEPAIAKGRGFKRRPS